MPIMKKSNKTKPKAYSIREDDTIAMVNEAALAYINQNDLPMDILTIINQARKGITKRFLMDLAQKFSFTLQELACVMHLSDRTLLRYSDSEKLDTDASAKVLQLVHLYKRGEHVFGSSDNFGRWLRSNIVALEGKKPIEFLDTPFGFQLIDEIMGRIEYGIYS